MRALLPEQVNIEIYTSSLSSILEQYHSNQNTSVVFSMLLVQTTFAMAGQIDGNSGCLLAVCFSTFVHAAVLVVSASSELVDAAHVHLHTLKSSE